MEDAFVSGRRHHHHHHAVSRRHTAPAVPISGPPTCSSCSFHERRHATAIRVSWSTVPLCGTVCRLRYVHQTRHWTYFKINWKLSSSELFNKCAFAALANLRGINHIIIIIINGLGMCWRHSSVVIVNLQPADFSCPIPDVWFTGDHCVGKLLTLPNISAPDMMVLGLRSIYILGHFKRKFYNCTTCFLFSFERLVLYSAMKIMLMLTQNQHFNWKTTALRRLHKST